MCLLISLSSIGHFLFTIQKPVGGLLILVCGSHAIEIPARRLPCVTPVLKGHFPAFSHGISQGIGESRVCCKAISYENPTKIKILKLVATSAVTAYRKHASLLRFTLWMVPRGY